MYKSAKDFKPPRQILKIDDHIAIAKAILYLLSATDLYILHPLLDEGELTSQRMLRNSLRWITAAGKDGDLSLVQSLLDQAGHSGVLESLPSLVDDETGKLDRSVIVEVLSSSAQRNSAVRGEFLKTLKTRHANKNPKREGGYRETGVAYLEGGLGQALESIFQFGLYDVAAGIHRWSDFALKWDAWITSVQDNPLSAVLQLGDHLRQRTGISEWNDALASPTNRRILETWIYKETPLLLTDAALKACLIRVDHIRVERALGYRFRNLRNLVGVLDRSNGVGCATFERLEWLGDSVIELLTTVYWISRPPGEYSPSSHKVISVGNRFLGFMGALLGCSRYMTAPNKWKAIRKEIVRRLNLGDTKALDLRQYSALPCLQNLDDVGFDDIVPYLRRRARVQRDRKMRCIWDTLEIPKSGGDVLEALFGAIYQDSGFDVDTVSRVYQQTIQVVIEIFFPPYYNTKPVDVFMSSMERIGCTAWTISSVSTIPDSAPPVPGSAPAVPDSVPTIPASAPPIPGSVPAVPDSVPAIPDSVDAESSTTTITDAVASAGVTRKDPTDHYEDPESNPSKRIRLTSTPSTMSEPYFLRSRAPTALPQPPSNVGTGADSPPRNRAPFTKLKPSVSLELKMHDHVILTVTRPTEEMAWKSILQQAISTLDEDPHHLLIHCNCKALTPD